LALIRDDFHAVSIAIVGNAGGLNVGESLRRAALSAGHSVLFFDAFRARVGPRFLRSLSWHFAHRRPLRLKRFSAEIVDACAQTRPDVLIATGAAPLTTSALNTLRTMGIVCMNYSTDDPWRPVHRWSPVPRSHWHLRALPAFDLVFTPRRANIDDLRRVGCPDVRYLPFGYDDALSVPFEEPNDAPAYDVLFVGGADNDRVEFMKAFMRAGPPVALCGGYWDRYPATQQYARGQKGFEEVRGLTAAAKVNLCLVRRANRDGHVMRSFEIAAIGGCMLVEDTEDHRALFGSDGEAVVFFGTPDEAAKRAHALIADSAERARLSASVRTRITGGAHTYQDRLRSMLDAAAAHHRLTNNNLTSKIAAR
jgi:spore maturation protein CgeB